MPTTIFKKDIPLKNVKLEENPEDFRSEEDSHIAASLGLTLTKTKSLYTKDREDEIKLAKKNKIFLSNSEYLELFCKDFWSIPDKYRAKYAAVWDFETSDKYNSYACSLAIELVNLQTYEVEEVFYKVMNPLVKMSAGAIAVHKISQIEAESQPTFESFYPEIKEILMKADFFVGQNLIFDMAVLERELLRMDEVNNFNQVPIFDTMKAAKGIVPTFDKNGRIKAPNLTEICLHYELIQLDKNGEPPVFHNAEVDVKYTRLAFLALLDEY